LAKRPRSARGLRFSSSRVGQKPVGNSFDHLVGAQEGCCGRRGARFCGQIGDFVVAAQVCAATEIAQFWGLPLGELIPCPWSIEGTPWAAGGPNRTH
jgi:hypothetical protein